MGEVPFNTESQKPGVVFDTGLLYCSKGNSSARQQSTILQKYAERVDDKRDT